MEKATKRTRDIRFYSEKNGDIRLVHTHFAKSYAMTLEQDDCVRSYEVSVSLQKEKLANVNPVDIRKEYFENEYASDFLLSFVDGSKAVRELVHPDSLMKKATAEKLELSRRYWDALGINDWKVAIPEEDK